jgi:hypothetical protein
LLGLGTSVHSRDRSTRAYIAALDLGGVHLLDVGGLVKVGANGDAAAALKRAGRLAGGVELPCLVRQPAARADAGFRSAMTLCVAVA